MRDYIQGSDWIYLEPQDIAVPYQITVTICSSLTANDGYIPYGTNVSAVTAIGYDSDSNIVTSELINGTPTVTNNVISFYLDYPSTTGIDIYKITFKLTLDNVKGTIKELDFVRIRALNV